MPIEPSSPARFPIGPTVTLARLLTREIMVGAVMNLLLNLLAAWLTFPTGAAIAVRGSPGLARDLLPATVMPALMMSVGVTIALRRRMRGGLHVLGAPRLPFHLPRSIWLRTSMIAILALGLVALPTLIALLLLWPTNGGWPQLIIYKLIFSAVHAAVLTPIMILAAVGDEQR